ncbi:MAG TPA: hypothetical protein VHP38_11335 [Ruminiclostridium sp.]|nr:hypothetical protein [Ruminiclostridium sp.]
MSEFESIRRNGIKGDGKSREPLVHKKVSTDRFGRIAEANAGILSKKDMAQLQNTVGKRVTQLSGGETTALNVLKGITVKNTAVQCFLKVGPVIVEEEYVDFIVHKIVQEANHIEYIYSSYGNDTSKPPADFHNPTWVAYQKGIPALLIGNQKQVREVVHRWATSSNMGLATAVESLSERFTGKRGEKAEWKQFDDFLELALAVGYELDPDTVQNRKIERELGKSISENPEIAERLNQMRIKVMKWIKEKYLKNGETFLSFAVKFKLGGSYNSSSPTGVARNFETLLARENLSFRDNIEILHDLMELTSESGAGSTFQKFGKVLTPQPRDEAYLQIGENEDGSLYNAKPMRTPDDHGPGGASWKSARYYDLKLFELELESFKQKLEREVSEGGIELQDVDKMDQEQRTDKELELNQRYSVKKSDKMAKAMNYRRKMPNSVLEKIRDAIMVKLELKAPFVPVNKDTLNKRSKGRHNVGTRDEFDPVTVLARRHNVPIEAGRSMTTARLLELCTTVLNEDPQGRELTEKGHSDIDAVAQSIFAYWAYIYNQALTPIHTYHEVMDVARHYGADYKPFNYKVMNENDMGAKEYIPMDEKAVFKEGIDTLKDERREIPYRVNQTQRDRLAIYHMSPLWVNPDGDCLFHALSAVGFAIGDPGEFRIKLADFFSKNIEEFRAFIPEAINPETVRDQIRRPGSYFNLGGDMTPLLIARYFDSGFSILNEDGSIHHINGGDMGRLIIRVTNPLPHYHSTKVVSNESIELGAI